MALRKIKNRADDFGLMTYDPAFMNTASCQSAVTFIDGDRVSCVPGYPIDQLAEKCTFIEVATCFWFAELPTESQTERVGDQYHLHTMIHETPRSFWRGFAGTPIPWGCWSVHGGALSTVYPEARMSTIRTRNCRSCA